MGKKFKLPLEVGFTALCNHIKAIRATAEQSGSAVASLAESTAEGFAEIDGLLNGKQDKTNAVPISIPAAGWASDDLSEGAEEMEGDGAYPYYFDLPAEGVTPRDRADVQIAPDSLAAATACGLCPTTETLDGKIRLRAVTPPAEALAAEYWLCSGKE